MVRVIVLISAVLVFAVDADAARYWVKSGGTGNCGTAVGDTDPGVYLVDPTAGVACMSGGDRLTIKAGAYTGTNGRIRNVPSGTAANPTIIEGDPSDGHLCALQHTCKAIIRTSSSSIIRANNVVIDRIEFDGVNNAGNPLYIGGVGGTTGTCTNVLVQSVETWNTQVETGPAESGIYTDAGCSFLTFRYVHSHHNGTISTHTDHGIYLQAKDALVEDSSFHNNGGLGVQCYSSQPAPNDKADRCIIRRSVFYNNLEIGIALEGADGQVYDNLIYNNGSGCIAVGYGGAPRAKIHNNTCIDNVQRVASSPGINMGAASGTNDSSNSTVHNNIIIGHSPELTLGSGSSGTTVSHNACTSAGSCGTTGKVTITSAGQWLVDPANGDFTLKAGTNDLVNAGTTVSTRPSPVGTPDIGAYERGLLSSAAVATGHIEINTNTVASGVNPTSGITGVTIACVGCTGTPVASSVAVKPGTTTVLQVVVSGISSSGTCTVSLGSSNLTDSVFIAGLSTNAQKLNTVSGLAVSGTCTNTTGASTSGTAHYLLEEGTGTTVNDETVNNNDGTVTGITWVTGGIYIPRDATYRHLEAPFGASTDPSASSGAACANVEIEEGHSQGIVFSSGSSGTDQRLNFGWFTVGGQMQWGISVQGQFWTDGSEFVAETKPTLVCAAWDSATDTMYLWVNGVKGVISGKSVRTYTSFTTTATNFRFGNLGTGTTNNGGMTIYEAFLWDTLPTDQDFADLYTDLFPAGSSLACYEQKTHSWESVHTLGGSSVTLRSGGTQSIVEGGAVALVVQIDCTGSAGADVALTFFYSEDGTNFNIAIPSQLGAAGIAMIGSSWIPTNTGAAACCITGALTANHGPTLTNASTSPTITLSQNHSYTIRVLLKVGTGIAPKTFWIKAKQANGAVLANGYTPSAGAQLNVISPQAGGVGF